MSFLCALPECITYVEDSTLWLLKNPLKVIHTIHQ